MGQESLMQSTHACGNSWRLKSTMISVLSMNLKLHAFLIVISQKVQVKKISLTTKTQTNMDQVALKATVHVQKKHQKRKRKGNKKRKRKKNRKKKPSKE